MVIQEQLLSKKAPFQTTACFISPSDHAPAKWKRKLENLDWNQA